MQWNKKNKRKWDNKIKKKIFGWKCIFFQHQKWLDRFQNGQTILTIVSDITRWNVQEEKRANSFPLLFFHLEWLESDGYE
jgi:hypothetical protein